MSGVQPEADQRGSSGGASSAGGGGWTAGRGGVWNSGGAWNRGGAWSAARGGAWRGNDGGDGGQAADDGRQAAADGQAAGEAGPPVSVEFKLTDQDVWQAAMGGGTWLDVDPTWTEPLLTAMRNGERTIRLLHIYQNKYGEEVRSWYVIDCADATAVTQKNEATGKERKMRLVQLMEPAVVQPQVVALQDVPLVQPHVDVHPHAPLPPERPADPEGDADTQIAG